MVIFCGRKQIVRSVLFSSSALILLWGAPGFAAEFEWTGAESTDWYTPNNWLENGSAATNIPLNGDTVTINTQDNAPVLPTDGGTDYLKSLIIGDTAGGSLTSNATITGERATIGASAGGDGALTLGSGGQVLMDKGMIVGDAGTGQLDIASGAQGQTNLITLGNGTGGSGVIELDGAGSQMRIFDGVTVGNSGSGSIAVSDGAMLETNQTVLGSATGGEGTITLSGSETQWTDNGAVTIGSSGTGTVLIQTGAQAINGSLSMGENASSVGNKATVTGAGSAWTVYNDISIGGNVEGEGTGGSGTLSVLDGATLSVSNANIGNVASSEGTVNIAGAGSTLQLTAALGVGVDGEGSLSVSNGGSVKADSAIVGANASGVGEIRMTGADSQLSLINGITVGVSGAGQLVLDNAAVLTINGGRIGKNAGSVGAVTLSNGASWTNISTMDVGAAGEGLISVSGGSTLSSRTTTIGSDETGVGIVEIDGAGSSWSAEGAITVGAAGNGLLYLADGAVVTSTASVIGAAPDANGAVVIYGEETNWNITGDLTVGQSGNGVLAVGDGGTLTADNLVFAENAGSLGVLAIGGAPDQAARAPGFVDVNTVSLGSGQGLLVFNHTASDYEFAQAVTGTVDIEAQAGRTILTADNTNEGDTSIASGAEIQVGNGGMTGTLNGDVEMENGGTLSFDRSDEIAFKGTFSGSGTISQKGTGTLRLAADSDAFSGVLDAEAGTFLVEGDLRGTTTDVKSGARFGGSGIIGSTTVRTGGAFLSGDELGSITVDGDLTFEDDATYVAVIQSGEVPAKVTGAVAFDETEIDVDFTQGGALKQQYTLLEAGSITGTWNAPLSVLPSQFRGTIEEDANRLNMSLAYVGGNFNFSALGERVNTQLVNAFNDGVPLTGTLSAGMLQSGSAYEAAMTTLGGELGVNASMTANLGMQNFLRRSSNPSRLLAGWRPIEHEAADQNNLPSAGETAALAYWNLGTPRSRQPQWDWANTDRNSSFAAFSPYSPFTPSNTVWLEYSGQNASVNGDSAAGNSGADLKGDTVEGGFLAQINDATAVSLSFGGGHTSYDQTEQDGSADNHSFHAALSAAGQTKQGLYGIATVGLGIDDIDTRRNVSFGNVSDQLRGSYSATTFGGRIEGGGRIVNNGVAFIPFAAASAVYTSTPSYQEEATNGLGSSALAYSNGDIFRGTVEAGVGFDTAAGDVPTRLSFNSRVSYLYRYGGGGDANANFLALPGYGFSISSNAPKGSAVAANIGTRVQLTPQADLSLSAYGEWGADYSALIASAKLRYIW